MKRHKIGSFWAAFAALFYCSVALAQTSGTVTNHAFVVGKGAGNTGYTSLLCGSAQLAVGQAAADPICQTITGDVTISAGGVTAIGATKVTAAMLNANVYSTAHSWAGQQTFVAPVLGTPASGVATNLTGTAAGLTAGNVTTNANLMGDVTSVGNATTLTNAPVIAKVLTGYTSGPGTVSAADSILSALQKINGNDALKAPLASPALTGTPTSPTATAGTNTTQIASTAFVQAAVVASTTGVAQFNTRTGNVVSAQGDYTSNLIPGDATGGNATAGNIGEFQTASAAGTAVPLTSGTAANCVTLSLTSGDWMVSGNVLYMGTGSTTILFAEGAVGSASATRVFVDSTSFYGANITYFGSVNGLGFNVGAPPVRISLASSGNAYLIGYLNFGASTATCGGKIRAWRIR